MKTHLGVKVWWHMLPLMISILANFNPGELYLTILSLANFNLANLNALQPKIARGRFLNHSTVVSAAVRTSILPSNSWGMTPSTCEPFILVSMLSISTRVSSCTSCCMKESRLSQPNDRVSFFVATDRLLQHTNMG